MIKATKKTIQRAFRLFGLDLRWHVPNPPHDLATLLTVYGVEAIFDIGANIGMSGEYFRNIGFRKRIVSFEPVKHLYSELERKVARDPLWLAENIALGDKEGEQEINRSGDSGGASSFLTSVGFFEQHAPELSTIGRELVTVKTLKTAIEKYYPNGNRLFLKIDAQGYERKILESARRDLDKVVGIRIEMSVVKIYEEEPLISEMLDYLYDLGYRLCAIEEAWSNLRTHEVFQVDAVLFRPERIC